MLNEEQRQTLYQDYMTMGIRILAESYVVAHGGEIDLPSFVNMTHRGKTVETKESIVEHVKSLFS